MDLPEYGMKVLARLNHVRTGSVTGLSWTWLWIKFDKSREILDWLTNCILSKENCIPWNWLVKEVEIPFVNERRNISLFIWLNWHLKWYAVVLACLWMQFLLLPESYCMSHLGELVNGLGCITSCTWLIFKHELAVD